MKDTGVAGRSVWLGLGLLALLAPLPACDSSAPAQGSAEEGGGEIDGKNDVGAGLPGEGGGVGGEGGIPGITHPNCTDGAYSEPLPNPEGDLAAAEANFSPPKAQEFIIEALRARYPTGADIVEGALDKYKQKNCVTTFLQPPSNPGAVYRQLSTIVHECGHFYDLGLGGFSNAAYWISPDLQFTCKGGSIKKFGGKTISRSLIRDDQWAPLHPPCANWAGGGDCDSYAAIYLTGDPNDEKFDSGDQGFDMLFEEVVQYVNSLATGYAFSDLYTGSVSERDGLLTFLWYLTRYLYLARIDYPDAYALLRDDDCWRGAILSVWGRAWTYLDLTEGNPRLGIRDTFLESLVLDPVLLAEIDFLRTAEGCTVGP